MNIVFASAIGCLHDVHLSNSQGFIKCYL